MSGFQSSESTSSHSFTVAWRAEIVNGSCTLEAAIHVAAAAADPCSSCLARRLLRACVAMRSSRSANASASSVVSAAATSRVASSDSRAGVFNERRRCAHRRRQRSSPPANELGNKAAELEGPIRATHRTDEAGQLLETIPGVWHLTASALQTKSVTREPFGMAPKSPRGWVWSRVNTPQVASRACWAAPKQFLGPKEAVGRLQRSLRYNRPI
jgi:hypothetical protein